MWFGTYFLILPHGLSHMITGRKGFTRVSYYIKVKFSLCFFLTEHHAMMAYWGSGGIAPLIL